MPATRVTALSAWGALGALLVLALLAGAWPHLLEGLDLHIADVSDAAWTRRLDASGVVDRTSVLFAVAVGVGLATLRCPVVAMTSVVAAVTGVVATRVIQSVVDRPGPGGPVGRPESFPDATVVHVAIAAGILTIAVPVWTRRASVLLAVAGGGAIVTVSTAAGVAASGSAWATDAVGGVLLGASVVLVAWWTVAHPRLHTRCASGAWRRAPDQASHPAVVPLPPHTARRLATGARVAGALAIVVLGALAIEVGLPRNPDGESLGQVEVPLQVGLLALVVAGVVVSLRWSGVGATLMLLGGLGLGTTSAIAHPPGTAIAVTTAFVLPAILVWAAWQHDRSLHAIATLSIVTSAVLLVGWTAADALHRHYFGPAHPESELRAEPLDEVRWIWSGAVTPTTATVVARLDGVPPGPAADAVRLRLTPTDAGEPPAPDVVTDAAVGDDGIVRWDVGGLAPATEYRYVVEVGGRADASRGDGVLRTFDDGAHSFTVAVASCARTGSNGAVFDTIRELDPDLYVNTGDLHYGNVDEDDTGLFLRYYDRVLTAASQAALYAHVPVGYVWDDHDYGPNDADSTSSSRDAARAAFARAVPHYPLANAEGAVYQAFTIGRVRFVMTDTRSERTDTSMLGEVQLAWFVDEVRRASPTHALVVWVNPDPWIAPSDPARDDWGAFAEERRYLADVIADLGTDNLVMLSGDAHMVALDDGTNSNFSTGRDGERAFPVLHAAALDRRGTVKGGPYSEGAFPGAGQFGTLRVTDDGGDRVTVELAGHRWDGETVVSLTRSFDVPATAVTG